MSPFVIHERRSELDTLGAFVHGWLAAFHALGVVYNWRRQNRFDALVHTLALGYDARAMLHHLRKVKSCDTP